MISLSLARRLKEAGLQWQPAMNDYFAIPERGMDERVFVISDILVTLEFLRGQEVVAFQGASEWALDNLVTSEVVWLPREDQLRQVLEAALLERGRPELHLDCGLDGCRCNIHYQNEKLTFYARQADEAYAEALLYLLAR